MIKQILSAIVLLNSMYLVALQNTSSALFTSWIKSTGYSSVYKTYLTNIWKITYTSSYAIVYAQGIPSYTIGPWSNPNTPSGQGWIYMIPVSPTVASSQTDLTTYLGQIGAWTNGMPIYNAYDGFTFANQNVWHRNAFWWEYSSFDACLGHPDVMGIYHNHVVPICMVTLTVSTSHSPIIGWSFDGYPIYGPYGYTNTYGSAITRITSGYALYTGNNAFTNQQRQKLSNGTTLVATYYGPNINSTYPNGVFLEDWLYASSNGMLDACNGRTAPTPEYPSGTYAYYTTVDSSFIPFYPFVIGPCYYGVATTPNGKGVTVPSSVTTYYSYSSANSIEINKSFYFLSLIAAFLISKIAF